MRNQSDSIICNTLIRFVLVFCCALSCANAQAEHTIQLRGVMNLAGLKAALLEVDHLLPGNTNAFRDYIGNTRLVKEGETFEDSTIKGATAKIELLKANAENMTVTLRDDGTEKSYSIPFGQGFGKGQHPGQIRLALAGAALNDVVDIYSLLANRIVLSHPDLRTMGVSMQSAWDAKIPTKADEARALENYFRGSEAIPVIDGQKFVLLVPIAKTNNVTPRSKNIVAGQPDIKELSLKDANEAVRMYGQLTGRRRLGEEALRASTLYFRAMQPISKTEAIYVIETLLDWNGIKIIEGKDRTFRVVQRPTDDSN
jgi:hypothetical protein